MSATLNSGTALADAMPGEADVVTREPLNAHASWDALALPRTPTSGFYTRNNFRIPELSAKDWRLVFSGTNTPLTLTYDELTSLPAHSLDVVLECAGNARTYYEPKAEGTPWGERAVACGRFTGARLADVLARAGVPADTLELVFRGADRDSKRTFERSLPMEAARDRDVLLAYEMNGAPLEPMHGAPVRLIVPRWYGVASVKWLVEVRATREPFRGHFQAEKYVYSQSATDPGTPVREKRVQSLIVSPRPDERLAAGPVHLTGWAWSGHAPIVRVEVSLDGGASWKDAALEPEIGPYAWRGWKLRADAPHAGELAIVSRAHDAAGNVQPDTPSWNYHGYGYNAPRRRRALVS